MRLGKEEGVVLCAMVPSVMRVFFAWLVRMLDRGPTLVYPEREHPDEVDGMNAPEGTYFGLVLRWMFQCCCSRIVYEMH